MNANPYEIPANRLFPEEGQEVLRREIAKRWAQNDGKAYNNSVRALKDWIVSKYLGEMHCPTLVISGDRDYTPVSYKQSYVAKMPEAKLEVISDSRHVTPLDQPERFNETVAEFLRMHS